MCRDAAKQVAALRIPSRADVARDARGRGRRRRGAAHALGQLHAIKPPKPDRTEIAKWVALVDQTIDQADLSAAAQKDGEIQRGDHGQRERRRPRSSSRRDRAAYGLRMCVQAAAPPPSTSTTTSAKAGA